MAAQDIAWKDRQIRKIKTGTIQINLGDRCNQKCAHCHIGASPQGTKNMDHHTAARILEKLSTLGVENIEFTGGTPELNPNLAMLIEGLSRQSKKIAVRTSLTVLDLPEYSFFIGLYEKNKVKLIASLPSAFEDLTDAQRGKGVFKKSLNVLRKLNSIGYGTGRLALDLVYNPVGGYLPPAQPQVEKEYRQMLREMHDISFDNLITIVNSPITRFKNYLLSEDKLDDYMRLLVDNFNPETLEKIMCRYQVSVDYRGHIYDCDFNLALGIRTKGYDDKKFWEIAFNDFSPEITCDVHCYACTVNAGSSCRGVLIKEETKTGFDAMENAKKYYGETLHGTSDLKTSACCTPDSLPAHVKKVLPYIAEEIKIKYYGCGSPIPVVLDGLRVLDLGCGTGRDTYVMSKLVGQNGFVYGLDMTEKQLEVARRYIPEQTARFGYERPNVRFIQDYIENAGEHFKDGTLDLIISNCVINLVEDKESIIKQVRRMLKPGGEFYFSDVYSDRRIPAGLKSDPVLHGECLGGALYYKDFERMARRAGFADPRIVSKRIIGITNEEIKNLTGNITFYSITYRLWKLERLEDACEEYGHVAVYKGGIAESPFRFELDSSHVFEKNLSVKVCGNTALMLSKTRFRDYFRITGSFDEHFGEFKDCGSPAKEKEDTGSCGC